MQVSSAVALGGAFSGYSVAGGTQREFRAQFLLYSGNWWLAIDGVWIGYYPASVSKPSLPISPNFLPMIELADSSP